MKKFNYKYKTTEEFTKQAIKTHGNKYNYSLVNYVNAKTPIKIICQIHGEFFQIPRNHIRGQQCQKCSGVYMDTSYFKEKAIKMHGNKYIYSLVEYSTNLKPVKIICPIHGEFKQRPKDHIIGKGCQKCSGVYMNTDYFKEKANKKHNFNYSYDKTIFKNATSKIIITCNKHGDFEQTPNAHINGRGCPICKKSKGELDIQKFLKSKNIKFIHQFKFNDCRNIKPLPFDFYLPELNICIEYNGEQHYKPIKYFGGYEKFQKQIKNDLIKLNYCKINNINLIIINDVKIILQTWDDGM